MALLPGGWRDAMKPFLDPDVVARLSDFVAAEYRQHTVYPPLADLFRAFRLCPPEAARVLILGQDPYHGPGRRTVSLQRAAGGRRCRRRCATSSKSCGTTWG